MAAESSIWHDIITTIPPTIAALATLVAVLRVGQRVDGRLTQLLDLTATSSHAEGVAQGKNEQNRASKLDSDK
jgi:hypothetical protein